MSVVTVDQSQLQALVSSPKFKSLFPTLIVTGRPTKSCCGQPPERYRNLKERMLNMSSEQARRVARVLNIAPGKTMQIRVVYKDRVDTRSFKV